MALHTRTAHGGPLDDPHVGGIGFAGPTTGDLTSIYWNPGAVGLIEGTQVVVTGTGQFGTTSVKRPSMPSATGTSHQSPATWPPGPGTFMAIGAAIGNRFTLALATFTPFVQRLSYAPTDGDPPTRYHLVQADLRNVALVTALAFRIGSELRIGVAPGFMFSTGRLVFDEDTALDGGSAGLQADCGGAPCGVENPAAAARYDVGSGLALLDSSLAFTLAGGIHYRRGPIAVGVAYASHPIGGVEIEARRSRVKSPARLDAAGPVCPAGRESGCVYGHLAYDLPDIYTVGVTWQATQQMALTGIVRYLTYSRHEDVSMRLVGPPNAFATRGLTERMVLHRGFRDVIEARVRAVRDLAWRTRLSATLRAQSSAVPASRLNAAAVDGPTLEPSLAAEVRLGTSVRLTAGYAFAFTFPVDSGDSVFDPGAATACADAGGDLDLPACRARRAGSARPGAAGEYGMIRHAGSVTATFRF